MVSLSLTFSIFSFLIERHFTVNRIEQRNIVPDVYEIKRKDM